MAYIYLTRSYLNDLEDHTSENRRFKNQIDSLREQPNPEGQIIRFKSSNIFKKRVGNCRIIFQKIQITIENKLYDVYCALNIFAHNDSYTEVYDPDVFQFQKENDICKSNEYETIVEWLKEEILKTKPKLRTPPDLLVDWLNSEDFEIDNTIFEMYEWTVSIQRDDVKNFRADMPETIFNIFDNNKLSDVDISAPRSTIKLVESKNDIFMLYEKYGSALFLYKVYKNRPSDEDLKDVIDNYYYEGNSSAHDLLKRDAKRAYPVYILADTDLWFKIQEDSIGNLALSPEQVDLIRNPEYPIFINGQAGSGKSTMLFYLFAHLFYTHRENVHKPVFFTYNKKLLETARQSIKAILKNHPNFSENFIEDSEIDSLFYPFQDFIFNRLLTEEQRKNFPKSKYVSFYKFRRFYFGNEEENELCCKLNNKKDFTPELVWHIVRSYLKGSTVDNFSNADYIKLPRKDKSVSDDVIKQVIDTIYNKWYKGLESKGYWDDQDLIRFVLKENQNFIKYPLIFCDESQDFTKNEIELILKLSSFTDYDLTGYKNFPIAFAGDPYQTINPTGFRWESLKSIFSEKFSKLISRGNIEINFNPLSQNYRSKPAIIKFSNTMQLFRHIYLNINELEPQIPYQRLHSIDPCLFVLGQNIQNENIKVIADSTIFIVPCDSDVSSEIEFVAKDDTLNQFISIPSEEEKPIANVLSAASSKGLEYDTVIVYKFGSNAPASFQKAINGQELNDSESIELSHYFNKLYVAVSRARDFLFIVEDENGKNNFWKHFMNYDLFENIFEKNGKWRREHINLLIEGQDKDSNFMKENDPLKVAKEFEENGMTAEDPIMLLRAAQFYGIGNKHDKALNCAAWSAFYREKWDEAGQKFKDLGKLDEAQKSYWRGQCWYELITMLKYDKILVVRISKFMTGGLKLNSFYNDNDLIDRIEIGEITWNAFIDKVRDELKVDKTGVTAKAQFAFKIAVQGYKDFFDIAADFYYSDKLYEKAIEMWDRNKGGNHPDYFQAKLNISSEINDVINWLSKLNRYDEILLYKSKDGLTQSSHNIIFGALLSKRFYNDAVEYESIPVKTKAERIFNSFGATMEEEEILKCKQLIIIMLLSNEETDYLIKNNKVYLDALQKSEIIRSILKTKNGLEFLQLMRPVMAKVSENSLLNAVIDAICNDILEGNAKHINFALDIVYEDKKKMIGNNVRILKAVANSVDKLDLSTEANRRINGLLRSWFWETSEWRKYKISMIELAVVAEKNGYLLKDLYPIYELIIKFEPRSQQKIAKENYLRIKQDQAEFEKERGNIERANEIIAEMKAKSEEWNLSISKKPPLRKEAKPIEMFGLKIYGLEGIRNEIDSNKNRIIFTLPNYELRINTRNLMISVESSETSITDNINILTKEFNIKKLKSVPKYKLRFSESLPKVDLEIDGRKISIELNIKHNHNQDLNE